MKKSEEITEMKCNYIDAYVQYEMIGSHSAVMPIESEFVS